MQEWRQRQAAREIQYYQHLVDDARAHQGRRGNPWDVARAKPRSQSGGISAGTTIVIAILIVFAVLHIVGGTLIMERSARSPVETQAVMVWGD